METRRWLNQSQPQTLVIAVLLMYFDAVFLALGILTSGAFISLLTVLLIGSVAAGYGIANERKWGYWLGIAVAVLDVLINFGLNRSFGGNIIGLAFAVAKFALLVHPQSREYQKIWFK